MRTGERTTLAMGVVVVLLAGACGSDDGSTTGSGGGGGEATTATGGAGGTGGTGGSGAAGGAGGGVGCGAIGSPCDTDCPDGLTCYEGSFCIPAAADCGGFAGATCPSGQVCMTLSGADYGPCGTDMVKDCVCAGSPAALADCP